MKVFKKIVTTNINQILWVMNIGKSNYNAENIAKNKKTSENIVEHFVKFRKNSGII